MVRIRSRRRFGRTVESVMVGRIALSDIFKHVSINGSVKFPTALPGWQRIYLVSGFDDGEIVVLPRGAATMVRNRNLPIGTPILRISFAGNPSSVASIAKLPLRCH